VNLLSLADLTIDYRTSETLIHATQGVTLTVQPGERIAIVGESGSGKTTIANAAIGLLPSSAQIKRGRIEFEGTDLTGLPEARWRRIRGRRIGYIPQDPMLSLNPVRTIGKHLRDAIVAQGLAPRSGWRPVAVARLAEAGLPDPERVLGQFPHELSGGMRQRALIALALLSRPPLIIADEPTSALDVIVQRQVLDHLESLIAGTDAALLLITHDVGLVADRTERIIVMHNGHIVEAGPTQVVLSAAQHPYTQRLLSAVPRLSAHPRPALPAPAADAVPVLQTDALTKVFRRRRHLSDLVRTLTPRRHQGDLAVAKDDLVAVNRVDLTVQRGECRALVGESGSGKSTVARLIVGLERPTAGRLLIGGIDRTTASPAQRRALCETTQIVFQDPFASLDPQYSVRRILEEPLRVHGRLEAATRQQQVRDLLEQVQLPGSYATRFPSELSGGQRQRVAIARALALAPTLLVCDEAVSALDVLVQKQILDMLAELRQELDLAMLFITHDLAVVAEIADTVSVIQNGRIVDSGLVSDVFTHPNDPYTEELLLAIPGRTLLLQEAS
jgi:peptide/nickel transport system ATP-binding protein